VRCRSGASTGPPVSSASREPSRRSASAATNRIPPATALPDKRQPLPALAMALEDGA